jgi:hypothetical protein
MIDSIHNIETFDANGINYVPLFDGLWCVVGVIPAGHVIQAFEWTGCGIHRRSVDSTHSKALTILQKYFQNSPQAADSSRRGMSAPLKPLQCRDVLYVGSVA